MEVTYGFNAIIVASFRCCSGPSGTTRSGSQILLSELSGFERPVTFLDDSNNSKEEDNVVAAADINVVFIDDDVAMNDKKVPNGTSRGGNWFEKLKPKVKQRLAEKGQVKAIANKMKRESSDDKKRRKSWLSVLLLLLSSHSWLSRGAHFETLPYCHTTLTYITLGDLTSQA
jgi:hypothetical protein